MSYPNKREHAIALINEGGATKDSLMDALEINDKSLASVFAQMRLMGRFPLKAEDGSFTIGTADDFEALRANRAPAKERKILTPQERVDAAQKREDRATKVLTTIQARYATNDSEENSLRLQIAKLELDLATHLLYKAEQCNTNGIEPDYDEEGNDIAGSGDVEL